MVKGTLKEVSSDMHRCLSLSGQLEMQQLQVQ